MSKADIQTVNSISIDTKLKNILNSMMFSQEGIPVDFEFLNEDPVKAIKRVFVDEGWVDHG